MFSNGDSYENNVFTNNGAGVAVMYTKNVRMINNRFEDNWGPNSTATVEDITDSYMHGNTLTRNTTAFIWKVLQNKNSCEQFTVTDGQ
jgi:nitrous oxidase accessory protein